MARYDMTGIGINLREVPDENGIIRMKVLQEVYVDCDNREET